MLQEIPPLVSVILIAAAARKTIGAGQEAGAALGFVSGVARGDEK